MAKQVIRTEPGVDGVGQTLYFDDGSSVFDATNAYNAAAPPPAPAPATSSLPPPPPTPAPEVTDPMSGAVIPPPIPPTAAQQTAAASFLQDPVRAMRAPAAPAADEGPLLTPGIADGVGGLPEAQPQFALAPATRGGFRPSAKTITGVGAADREALSAGAGIVADQQGAASEAATKGQEDLIGHYEARTLHDYLQAQSQDLAALSNIKRNQMVQSQIKQKIDDTTKFKPNRTALFEGTAGGFRAILSAVGMIAGGALQGVNGGRNTAMDTVFKMVDDNVADQVAQNTNIYQELVRSLGDEQAAASVLRSQHLQAVIDMTKAMDLGTKGQEAKAALAGARERATLLQQQTRLDAMAKLAPQESLALAYRAPTPAHLMMIDQTDQALQMAGVSPKQYQEFTTQKLGNGDKTVGQAIQFVKEMDQDTATLRALSQEYGGKLPAVGETINFNRSAFLRNIGAKLGMKGSVDAGDVYKIYNRVLTAKAKAYGGVITKSDIDRAEAETGVTSGQLLDSMARMRGTANGEMMAVANGYFRGKAQFIMDTLMHGVGESPGVRPSGGRPR
jgi:hypothetical protein